MPAVLTDAVVLHAFDYLETSRILRLATREAGLLSVIARGARRSTRRFGAALDLFTSGVAEIQVRPGRDLQTLTSFEVTRPRFALAVDLGRFTAATALCELVLRFASEDPHEALHDALVHALDRIVVAPPGRADDDALAGAWHLVGHLGFAPALDECASCRAEIDRAAAAAFSHAAGGTVCARCASLYAAPRMLPPEARAALDAWLRGGRAEIAGDAERRAHQRLLREFLHAHLADNRPLRAYEVWEHARWGGAGDGAA